MNFNVPVRNLQVITLLDSICYGMISGFITPYILLLGGSHVTVGILSVGCLVGDLFSERVLKVLNQMQGKRFSLFVILNIALVAHIMMVLTTSYWFTILARIIFMGVNQSQNLCKDLLLNRATKENEDEIHKIYSILSGMGFIVGPIISGYLFDVGFGYIGLLAALLTWINTRLLLNVTTNESDIDIAQGTSTMSLLEETVNILEKSVANFQESEPKKNWDLLLIKYLFTSSIIIFFSKFVPIIKYNYGASNQAVGFTVAYMNGLTFIASYCLRTIKSSLPKRSLVYMSEISTLAILVFLLSACYAPYYGLFLLLLIPIVFIRTYVMSTWIDLFSERKNGELMPMNKVAGILAGLTIPIIFGVVCNHMGHRAVILFSCLPALCGWSILRYHSKYVQNVEDEYNYILD